MPNWHDVTDLHRALAGATPAAIAPMLVGCDGDEPLMVLTLRPFQKGAYHDPVIEAMALAIPLGCDRISLSMAARAWSLSDPIPPVTGDADLRQQVLVETRVDGHRRRPAEIATHLHPFRVVDGEVEWENTLAPGPGEGWIPEALGCLVDGRDELVRTATFELLVDQMRRLDTRGHRVGLTPAGQERLVGARRAG